MSKLRPETVKSDSPASVVGPTAYYCILGSVEDQNGLIHGRLQRGDRYCAIGSYFAAHPGEALSEALIDEIAAVNDSKPHATPKQRKAFVVRWLKWKLTQLGMPGYRTVQAPS